MAVIMPNANVSSQAVSGAAKLSYGILLPILLFVFYQLVLIGSKDGSGSWDGMSIFFGSLFIVPALLIANCWVLFIAWTRKFSLILAGILLPTVIGAMEFFWMHGPSRIHSAINAAFVAPFAWLWLLAILLFAPLAFFLAVFANAVGSSPGEPAGMDTGWYGAGAPNHPGV